MKDYDISAYGQRVADVYDDWLHAIDPAEAVAVLAELAGERSALELGIGTGRVALALQGRGVEVHGIDASEAMLEKLRAKPGGERIPDECRRLRGGRRRGKLRACVRRREHLLWCAGTR